MASPQKIKSVFRLKDSAFLNIVMPRFFGRTAEEDWTDVTFLDEPCCFICGYPFEFDSGAGTICAYCTANPPRFDHCRSAVTYDAASRAAILAFKHGGRMQNLDRFARQLRRAGRIYWDQADYLVPVPLHPKRLLKRKFNQAALLARALSEYVDAAYDPDILYRHKNTASQGLQTPKGRFRNVRNAFSLRDNAAAIIDGKTIVIIDDVYTTGATLGACASALKKAGAAQVFTLTLSRVVRPQQIPT